MSRMIDSPSVKPANSQLENSQKMLLDYIISHSGQDQRPYLEVFVLGVKILGLLDSGASSTIVGDRGLRILRSLGLQLSPTSTQACMVANGVSCKCVGMVQVPMALMDKVRLIDVLVVPDLPHTLILGVNFWREMNVIPNLKSDVWHFGEETKEISVCGIEPETNLSPEQLDSLKNLLDQKFQEMGDGLGFTKLVEHEIVTDSEPIKQRYYPVSPIKQKLIDEELDTMLRLGVVEPSKSPWSSPVLLVPKSDGTYRFCVDYRSLNAVTKKDAYPIPYVSSILDRLRNAKYLTSLDIRSAYWQVGVKQSSREFTAFTVPGRGLYHFKRMPFGLTNAPATWSRLIDTVLGADLEPYVFFYLDDIIIISPDFATHLRILSKVFDRLIQAGLTVSREKCKFCRPSLKYLGYVVDAQGLKVDPGKVEAILNISPPKSVTEVRSFIGVCSWYRKFIPGFSTLLEPITRLTKKNVRFCWSPECEAAFRSIKNHLVSAPILTCPDFSRPFSLQTDASAYGIGAVLTQNFEDGEKVICYLSRSLTRQEKNYSTTERECLAVIWAVEKLKHYLEGVHFTIVTDHFSLLWLNRLKNPTGRLARWALRLQPFDFTIIHRKGKDNVVPDFLSRSVPRIDVITVSLEDLSQTNDTWYRRLIEKVRNSPGKYPQFRLEGDVLYKYVKHDVPSLAEDADFWKIVVPKDRRRLLLRSYHDDETSGHIGSYKVYWKLHQRYTWPKMQADVVKYVRSCWVCAEHKPEQKAPAGLMGNRPKITKPWQMISIDFVGPLPRSTRQNKYILVVTDYFSKYVVLFSLRSATSAALCRHMEEDIFLVYGVPQMIVCDNGVQMKSRDFRTLCTKYNVDINFTPLYYPRANPCERMNKIVKTMISCYVGDNQRKWDAHLAAIGCAIRTAKSEVTGYSPFLVNFGRTYVQHGKEYTEHLTQSDASQMDVPSMVEKRQAGFQQMYRQIEHRLNEAHNKYKNRYNLRRRVLQFAEGDRVWRRNKVQSDALNYVNAKLAPKFVGPFVITRKLGNWTYELSDETGNVKGVWNVQDLKPCHQIDPG